MNQTILRKQYRTLLFWNTYDFSENQEKLYTEIKTVKMFIKEQFFIVKSSIENIDVTNGNQESKELLNLIRQQNCVLQEENALTK